MNRSEMTRHLEHTVTDLNAIRLDLGSLWSALAEHEGTIPAGDTSERVSGGGGGGSPVERAAGRRDPARDARRRIERDVTELAALARVLRQRVEFWTRPASAAGAGESLPGCEVCATVGKWEAASSTTAGGNLAAEHRLCRGHREFVVRTGRLPTKGEAEQQAQGRRPRARRVA